MFKENIFFSPTKEINKEYFRGEVVMVEVLNQSNSIEHELYHVSFKNGALTTLHYHESEQILIGTKGKGIVCLVKGDIVENLFAEMNTTILNEGDVVSIPPFVWHFHGALKGDFSHIALRNRYRSDSSLDKQVAKNLWEKDFLNQLTHLDTNEIQQIVLRIDQKVKEIVQLELEKT
ncbi:MAG: cupin domain-containing protein [Nitrososphaeraceae archaeon]